MERLLFKMKCKGRGQDGAECKYEYNIGVFSKYEVETCPICGHVGNFDEFVIEECHHDSNRGVQGMP